jgi:hypothetical protein
MKDIILICAENFVPGLLYFNNIKYSLKQKIVQKIYMKPCSHSCSHLGRSSLCIYQSEKPFIRRSKI